MDYEPRVVKLEVTVETVKDELTLLRGQVSDLDQKLEKVRDENRKCTDDLRLHLDRRFSEIHTEQTQLRRDFEKLIYAVTGMTITNLLAIIAIVLKAIGVY